MFSGFPQEGLKFLAALDRNNTREWFQPRKSVFDAQVRSPMLELVAEINTALSRFAPDHVTDPAKAVYRIYRDTRFSSDKTPYKTHIAANFPRRGMEKHAAAGYYFHISPKEIMIAGGVYMPGPEQLLAIRRWLAGNHTAFLKAARKPEKLMGTLQGEALSRPPKGFPCDHPALDLIKMKQWVYFSKLEPAIAATPKLAPRIIERFLAMAPVIDLLNQPLAKKNVRAAAP